MQKYADYIKEIEIESLWSGQRHVVWQLDRRVNVLSGVNGVGKSTILNKVVKGLAAGGEFPSHMLKGVHLTVSPADAKWIRYDIIRSFDRPLLNADMLTKVDISLVTELDWQLSNCSAATSITRSTLATASSACSNRAAATVPPKPSVSVSPRRSSRT